MKKILVLCTGNSCRSIIAEALINHLGQGKLQAVSAGSHPTGAVHPLALAVLNQHHIASGTPRSKSWNEFASQAFDQIITVCDQAAGETCPLFLGPAERLHWSIPDPAKAGAVAAFELAYQMLRAHIEGELLDA